MTIARSVAAVSALALALTASAQTQIPHAKRGCGGMVVHAPYLRLPPLSPKSQDRVQPSSRATDLCQKYTHAKGWRDTVRLYFGQGASEHRDLIEMAVQKWNEALEGFNQKPVIEIVPRRARNFSLPSDFWDLYELEEEGSEGLANDGQSTIYFQGSGVESSPGGFAYSRWDSSNHMVEADIYINASGIEEYGPHLVDAQKVFQVGGNHIYAVVDSIYEIILHEIGHALGLNHVPVSGNVMSYNYLPYMKTLWGPAITAEAVSQSRGRSFRLSGPFSEFSRSSGEDREYWYFTSPSTREIEMISAFTRSARLGEQDRSALLCAYEFSDWNH